MMENKVILDFLVTLDLAVTLDFKVLLEKRVNLGPLVAKGILVCLVKKETLDPLALKGLLVLLVIKGHQVLKVQLVRVAIQDLLEKWEDPVFQENQDFLVHLEKLVLGV
jgi:hypothetical protein